MIEHENRICILWLLNLYLAQQMEQYICWCGLVVDQIHSVASSEKA